MGDFCMKRFSIMRTWDGKILTSLVVICYKTCYLQFDV